MPWGMRERRLHIVARAGSRPGGGESILRFASIERDSKATAVQLSTFTSRTADRNRLDLLYFYFLPTCLLSKYLLENIRSR
jgi:hypothetical protein